jgi:2-dehydro-3-deoxyglucarate aldolase
VRGVALAHRSNRYGTVADSLKLVNDNIAVIAQIESRKAVAAIDEISAVEGIDCVFAGPSDLAASYGHLGNSSHPEVQDAIRRIAAGARTHGKSAGILTSIEADARRYLEMGFSFVGVGSDVGLLRGASQSLRDRFP